MKLFDAIELMSSGKQYMYDEEVEKAIVPYMVNTAFSQHYDTIMFANELNLRPDVTKKMCYDYYHFAIQPKKKRYAKWGSAKQDNDIIMVADYYKCSFPVAEQYRRMMNDDQMKALAEKMDTGGQR
jgi:hypothetical protein